MADDASARIAVVTAARRLEQLGLNHGSAGNVGLRVAGDGLVTVGSSLDEAVDLALEVEWVAKVWRLAGAESSPVHLLDDDEMARVAELFRDYGQPPERGS